MRLSIIILNYKSKGLVLNCLKSVKRYTYDLDYELIVVDNNSQDGLEEELKKIFKEVRFIQAGKNLGYSGGNNLGLKAAQGKYIALLNPDIVLLDNAFLKMVDFLEREEKVGLLGPQLLNPDGSIQYTRSRFPEFWMPFYRRTFLKKIPFVKRKIDFYLTKDKDYNTITYTDWIFGACLVVRREAMEKVGFLDERFFLGFEDTDWCRRFWQAGWKVCYFPKARLVHYPHRFSQKGFWSREARAHIASWLKYFWKHRKKSNIKDQK